MINSRISQTFSNDVINKSRVKFRVLTPTNCSELQLIFYIVQTIGRVPEKTKIDIFNQCKVD